MLRLLTFGGLSLEGVRPGAAPLGRRPLVLLALLAVSGERGMSRDKIIALLWPESDAERGRNSLSQALSAIRRACARDDLVVGGPELRLDQQVIASDVGEFERDVGSGELERATAAYSGPFLDGVFLRDAPELERWIEDHRSRLHHLFGGVLLRLAEQADKNTDAAAIGWWRRLSSLEPSSSRAALGLMQALVASGDRAAALQHYRVHESLLLQELGVQPEQAVAALAARLRNASIRLTPSAHLDPVDRPQPLPTDVTVGAMIGDESAPTLSDSPAGVANTNRIGATRLIDARHRTRRVAIGVAIGTIATLLVALRTSSHRQYDSHQVVVSHFLNRTGDSTLDAFGFLAADFIIDGVQRSGLTPVGDLSFPKPSTARAGASRLTEDVDETRLTAEATRAGIAVSGHYFKDGDSLAVVARVYDADQEKLVGVTETVRVAASVPAEGLQRVRQRVLGIVATHLDERLVDVFPLGASSPPTLDAYTEYLDGLMEFQRQEFARALPHFVRARELDSSFVAPLMWEAFTFPNLGRNGDRRAVVEELGRHRDQLTPVDHYALQYFEAAARHDVPAEVAALQEAANRSPGSIWSYNLGNLLNGLGRSEEAVAAFEQIDRTRGWTRGWLTFWRQYARALHYVDHRRELAVVRQARRILPGGRTALLLDEARALAALGRRDELEPILQETASHSAPARGAIPGNVLDQVAMELWNRGDTAFSRQVSARAIAWFRAVSPADAERREIRAAFGQALYDADQWTEARAVFERLVREKPGDWSALTHLGLCLARTGDRDRAEEVISRLATADSVDGPNLVVTSGVLGAARIAAVLGDNDRATRFIRELNARTGGRFSRHVQYKDFDSLTGYAPFLAVTQPVR